MAGYCAAGPAPNRPEQIFRKRCELARGGVPQASEYWVRAGPVEEIARWLVALSKRANGMAGQLGGSNVVRAPPLQFMGGRTRLGGRWGESEVFSDLFVVADELGADLRARGTVEHQLVASAETELVRVLAGYFHTQAPPCPTCRITRDYQFSFGRDMLYTRKLHGTL